MIDDLLSNVFQCIIEHQQYVFDAWIFTGRAQPEVPERRQGLRTSTAGCYSATLGLQRLTAWGLPGWRVGTSALVTRPDSHAEATVL